MEKAVCENWGDVDAGGDYNAYKMNAASRLPERLRASCVRFFEEWYTRTPYVDGIEETVAALKERGYKLYLLSNAPDYFYENIGHYRVFDLFDGFVVSGCEKWSKPDRRIYEIVLERFGLRAEGMRVFRRSGKERGGRKGRRHRGLPIRRGRTADKRFAFKIKKARRRAFIFLRIPRKGRWAYIPERRIKPADFQT